jgi:prepilin-type N-terminal cleavage/methylation domain-containing protein
VDAALECPIAISTSRRVGQLDILAIHGHGKCGGNQPRRSRPIQWRPCRPAKHRHAVKTRRGFSLVEVLVVMGIIGVLIGLALPAISRLRVQAQKTSCLNNLRNQAFAALAFEQAIGKLPPASIAGPFEPMAVPELAGHGVYACLIGYLHSPAIAADYQFKFDYTDAENQPIAKMKVNVLSCPGCRPDLIEVFERDENENVLRYGSASHYGPLQASRVFIEFGWGKPDGNFAGALEGNHFTPLTDIKDGAATTILFSEQGPKAAAWTGPATVGLAREAFVGGTGNLAPHPGGFTVVCCDGSARLIHRGMDGQVFGAMCTRAGGESIGED